MKEIHPPDYGHRRFALCLLFLLGASVAVPGEPETESSPPPELTQPNKRKAEATGMPSDDNHDPSNVILHEGTYYCWYTEHFEEDYEPFVDTRIRLLTSPDGQDWTDQGVALAPAEDPPSDAKGVLTPYVVPHGGKFYMFYDYVPAGFEGPRKGKARSGIALAVADRPDGPWDRRGPVLRPEKGNWDGRLVGDANVIRYDGQWWMYYKGFATEDSPAETRVGLATSRSIAGPFERHPENPLIEGHAFSAWKHRNGVAFVGGASAKPVVYWAQDGVHFSPTRGKFPNQSTGFYCPENFADGPNTTGVSWGIDTTSGRPRALYRFRCDLRVPGHGDE